MSTLQQRFNAFVDAVSTRLKSEFPKARHDLYVIRTNLRLGDTYKSVFNVELGATASKVFYNIIREEAINHGFSVVLHSDYHIEGDRVIVDTKFELKNGSDIVISETEVGECLLKFKDSNSNENAVRTASTRAFKRVVGRIIPFLDNSLNRLSEIVQKWADAGMKDEQALRQRLIKEIEAKHPHA